MAVLTRSHTKGKPSTPPKGSQKPTPRTPTTRATRKRSPPKTPLRTRSIVPATTLRISKGKKATHLLLPSEYELDEEGRTIEDDLTGCPKLSKFGWRVFAERTRRVTMVRPPRSELDGRLRPRYQGPSQPMVHYGVGCNTSEILAWEGSRSYKPQPGDPCPEETARHRLWFYLKSRRIDCDIEHVLSPDFEFVIALYSNHDQIEKQLVKEDEERCLRIIWKQLGLQERRPMWYWDRVHSGTQCSMDEYNVPNLYDVTVAPEDDDWE
ncbi:hypothetical protein PENSPDRAFT_681687 [Peniophora sp. CONT]|nr:hypothetical protein PENSPDRAFT_681687 [Peniophora sp. CONT]